ncbi:MAG: hypothetical protein EOP13_23255 [Pseudomonas sp.]|uniref:hypothetical protein n=1 Tax=Pseudomonas sp. TaxID=306 RepID=UPI001207F247|nr:hypothetical protein [Pseudomonas sp.]RZI69088.1 MAG: hypothetical protein EOP13_23255 [Pseudomonas sp.]
MNKETIVSGKPDLTFGTGGLAHLPPTMRYAGNVMWKPGADALVVGASEQDGHFLVTRLLKDGNVDVTFGNNGIIQGQILLEQISMGVSAFDVESSKTVIVVNTSTPGGGYIPCATRYDEGGILDPNYGQGGILQLAYPGTLGSDHLPAHDRLPNVESQRQSLATTMPTGSTGLTPSGKLIVGWWYVNERKTVIYQVDDTGKLDTSFNGVGYVTYPEALGSSSLSALLILASGKLLAVGEHRSESGAFYPFLVRYNETGTLDNEFGKDGSGVVELQSDQYAGYILNGCIETEVGNLIIFGRDAAGNARLIGLEGDGSIDQSFRPDKVPDVFEWLSAAYDGDKLVAAGHTSDPRHIIIARYNTDGSLDPAFGSDSGWVRLDYPGIPESPTPYDVKAVDEKILIAGGSFVTRILA